MRDKDGRVFLNAHVLGFLRRICKLLFWGIKPVFVFDGGAPVLKRTTIVRQPSHERRSFDGDHSLNRQGLTYPSVSRRTNVDVRKRVPPQHTQKSRSVFWPLKCVAKPLIMRRGRRLFLSNKPKPCLSLPCFPQPEIVI